jgi:hypothetical protein
MNGKNVDTCTRIFYTIKKYIKGYNSGEKLQSQHKLDTETSIYNYKYETIRLKSVVIIHNTPPNIW